MFKNISIFFVLITLTVMPISSKLYADTTIDYVVLFAGLGIENDLLTQFDNAQLNSEGNFVVENKEIQILAPLDSSNENFIPVNLENLTAVVSGELQIKSQLVQGGTADKKKFKITLHGDVFANGSPTGETVDIKSTADLVIPNVVDPKKPLFSLSLSENYDFSGAHPDIDDSLTLKLSIDGTGVLKIAETKLAE